jgi:hypothetical protein
MLFDEEMRRSINLKTKSNDEEEAITIKISPLIKSSAISLILIQKSPFYPPNL